MRKIDELRQGCMAKAGDQEMTFVLLSRDSAAPPTIRFWINERVRLAKNQPQDAQITEAIECAKVMEIEGLQHKPFSPPAASPEQAAASMEANSRIVQGWSDQKKLEAAVTLDSPIRAEQAAEVELPPLPVWKKNVDIPADVWDEAMEFDEDAPVAEWLVVTRRELRTALAESQRLRQELAKDDDTQAEMAKRIAELEGWLADCYRLSGADPDGNEDWRLASHAVEEVRRMRKESDEAEDFESRLRAVSEALDKIGYHPELIPRLRAIVEGK